MAQQDNPQFAGARTLFGALAAIQFTAEDEALARSRGTTPADLRNVVLSRARDLQASINELIRVTNQEDTRDQLKEVHDAIL